jgi:hypothetical protein
MGVFVILRKVLTVAGAVALVSCVSAPAATAADRGAGTGHAATRQYDSGSCNLLDVGEDTFDAQRVALWECPGPDGGQTVHAQAYIDSPVQTWWDNEHVQLFGWSPDQPTPDTWLINDTPLPGATDDEVNTPSFPRPDSGVYACIANDQYGSTLQTFCTGIK